MTLLLRQRIRPFTTNKALLGPPLHRDTALYPHAPRGRRVRRWSTPALSRSLLGLELLRRGIMMSSGIFQCGPSLGSIP